MRPMATRYVETKRVAVRVNLHVIFLLAGALVAVSALAAVALTLGSFPLSVPEVIRAVTGIGTMPERGDFIVNTLRMPRVLSACLAGSALAMSGAIFQGLVRNPLASPDIIGINGGASVFVVFWIVYGFEPGFIPILAFAGAFAAAISVYLLSRRGKIDPTRLILVGIGINALATAGVTFLVVQGNIDDVSRAYQWMAGSLYASSWEDVRVLMLFLVAIVPVAGTLMRSLRVLQMGDLTARSVGLRVELTRTGLLALGCGLAAVAVAATGPIAFIALMTPHIARMIAGQMTAGVFLFSAALGSILLLLSDMVAQHLFPVSLPVGVLTAAIGAPYFLFLLYRARVRI